MSQNIDFQYKYKNGDTWASGFINIDSNKFEFVCSYLFENPLEDLLNCVYQLVPNLSAFPRKQIDFTMLDEPLEYRWEFKMIDDRNVHISIYLKNYDLKTKKVFEDKCKLNNLIRAFVQCINSNLELKSNENIERLYREFNLHLKNH
ncbi:hypothetical protein [Gottfriedia sp. OAE603]|uniref:hypothetical protein n=1 Tax=Gottfriedia sp. OAE603 TaxID=2663872 RepID=UPI00347DC145